MIIKRITISFQKLISFPLVRVIFAVLLSFAFLVVAFPPLNIWPLVFIAFFPWFKILSTRGFSEKNIFWGGILFGFLYYVFFFHVYLISAPYPWLGISPYIVWGVVIAILVFMGLLHGLAWGLYSLVSKRLIFASRMSTFLIVTILSSFWIFIELILFYLNFDMGVSLGYFLPASSIFGQLAGVGGVWIVSFGVLMINWIFVLEKRILFKNTYFFRMIVVCLVLVVWGTIGWGIRSWVNSIYIKGASINGIVVQVGDGDKYSLGTLNAYDRLLRLVQERNLGGVSTQKFILLPETTYSVYPSSPSALSSFFAHYPSLDTLNLKVSNILSPGYMALFGFMDATVSNAWHNGASLVTGGGVPRTTYKRNLFPFGEFLPLKDMWSPEVQKSFPEGVGENNSPLSGFFGKISVIFCNEGFNSFLVARDVGRGAVLIADMASDFTMSRSYYADWQVRVVEYRAVENWRPLMLAASYARSVLVTPAGKEIATTSFGATSYAAGDLHIMSPISPWTRFSLIFTSFWLLGGVILLCHVFKKELLSFFV